MTGEYVDDFNILVVDDSIEYIETIKNLFESKGIEARYAFSGDEAIRMMEESPADLLFTDFNMQNMDGIELTRRARELIPDIYIVMITGNSSPEIRSMALKAGVSKMFAKPVNLKIVLDIVKEEKERFSD